MKRALALVAVVACKSSGPAPVIGATAPFAASDGAAAPAKPLVRDQIRDDGIGMITARTSPTNFKELFPDVKVTNDSAEDHDFDRYTVGKDLEAITNNEKSGFFKVTVWGKQYRTREGISPGSTVAQLAAAYPDATCKFETYAPNAEDFTRALYCTTAKYPHLGFYLDDASWKAKPGAVAVSAIAARPIDRVLWVPKVEE